MFLSFRFFFFSSRRRHTRCSRDWSSDVALPISGYLKGQTLEDMDRRDDAVATYRALASRYPARNVAGLALWRLGWIAYLRGDLGGAEQAWTRVGEIPGGRTLGVPALFLAWRAQVELTRLASVAPPS